MAGKFQIRSKRWDVGVLVGSLVVLVLGVGGLFLLQGSGNAAGGTTNLFVILLGIITFAFFAGPGLVYVLRKRVARVKALLPGGTMSWIRSHLYLPVLALVAAFAHAQAVPFRATLSSGKVLLVLGVLVSVGGLARHHLIGIQKAALNVNVAVGKLTTGQPRAFRRLIADYTDHKITREAADAQMAQFEPSLQEKWRQITSISDEVEKHFPRDGGQTWHIRQYKLWRALHPPLTIALFLVLAFHVWDVLGGTRAMAGEEERFAASSECADCHGTVFDEWVGSTMSHAGTSTINEAQLPITLSENVRIIEEFDETDSLALLSGRDLADDSQQELVEDNAQVCIDCHMPVGGSFTDDPLALLPFGEGDSPVNGNEAVVTDGIGCVVCHTMEVAPGELQGSAALVGGAMDGEVSGGGFGDMYGPIFEDPNPLPVRIHGIETPGEDDEGLWRNDLETSQLCGACHNVKLDIDGDGLSDVDAAEEQGILDIIDDIDDDGPAALDEDADFTLDENELDDDRIQTEAGVEAANQDDGGDGLIDDLVLQTTFDEWQDYVAFFEADGGFTDRYVDAEFPNELNNPLGCTNCHMPLGDDIEEPVVDYAPGVLGAPDRFRRQHTFVGVDYDLDPELYRKGGLSDDDIARIVAERDALVQSAVTLQVVPQGSDGAIFPVEVVVRNNLLAHSFPTGFAFARQFWVEISAEAGGEPVCLLPAFEDDSGPLINVPCGSGFADVEGTEPVEGDEELRQCDTRAVAEALGVDADDARLAGGVIEGTNIVLPNLDIDFAGGGNADFAGSFGPDECDPWLANFQKILTDGDPDGDGVRQEVPYQPLLPDAVKIRGQVVSGLPMAELQPVRVRDNDGDGIDDPSESVAIPYVFTVPDGVDPDDIVVTARLRFRHLPPYFVRDLEARQVALGDDGVPEGARIDADALLEHMVVADVVEASSDDDEEQLACPGPQNGELSILSCVDEGDVDDALERLGLGDDDGGGQFERGDEEGRGGSSTGAELAMWGPLGMAVLVPIAGARRRSRVR
jgi:cytochrome c553